MGNNLILLGIIILILGILLNFSGKIHFPMLPGDILIQRDNFTFYFPIVSSIIVSIVLTIIINFFRR